MGSLSICCIIFGRVFGGALLGLHLRAWLPQRHLSPESKEIVQLETGLIGTMAALVLGLLVSSAKSSYDVIGMPLTPVSYAGAARRCYRRAWR